MKVAVVTCLVLLCTTCVHSVTDYSVRVDDAPITVNCNNYLEKLIEMVRIWMVKHGMDPLQAESVEKGFSFKIGFIRYHGEVKLTNGWFQGLSTLARSGNCDMAYEHELLNLKMNLAVDPALLNYDYSAQLMNIGPKGGIEAKVTGLAIYVDVMLDTKTTEITLQNFQIKEIGKMSLKFSGHPLLDWMTNILTDVVSVLLKGVIKGIMETEIKDRIIKVIDEINSRGTSASFLVY